MSRIISASRIGNVSNSKIVSTTEGGGVGKIAEFWNHDIKNIYNSLIHVSKKTQRNVYKLLQLKNTKTYLLKAPDQQT